MTAGEQDEIAASIAAHRELGPDYDKAVAEGLVERIGAEIDKRVDGRLRASGKQPQPPAPRFRSTGADYLTLLISLVFGTGATGIVTRDSHVGSTAQVLMLLLIWAAIAAINVAYAVRR